MTGSNPPPSTVTYIPSDDLESLFFIFLEFTIIYGGPKGQEVPKDERLFPIEYDAWTKAYATMDQAGLWSSGTAKHVFFTNRPLASYEVSEYFKVCYPIVEEWRKAIGHALLHGNQVSHKEILEIINRGLNDIGRTAPMSTNIASSSAVPAAPEVQITESAGSSGASVVPAVPVPMVPTSSVVPAAPTLSSAPQLIIQHRQSARIRERQTETPGSTSRRSLGKQKKRSLLSP